MIDRRRGPRRATRHSKFVVLAASLAMLAGACTAGTTSPSAPFADLGSSPAVTVPIATPSASPEPTAPATPAATPVPTPIPGTGRIVVAAFGFSITLPAGWRRVPLDGSSLADILAALPPGSSIAPVLRAEVAQAKAGGFAFLAIDLRPATLASGNASTVNVNVQEPSTEPLSVLEPLVTGLLSSAPGVSNVAATQVTLPAGKALRITYTLDLSTTGGTVKLAGTQFVVLSAKHTYTVSFGCRYASASSCRSQADAMMRSFQLL